jgi:hypothetical protein
MDSTGIGGYGLDVISISEDDMVNYSIDISGFDLESVPKLKCQYCGRMNLIKNEVCNGCGAVLPERR